MYSLFVTPRLCCYKYSSYISVFTKCSQRAVHQLFRFTAELTAFLYKFYWISELSPVDVHALVMSFIIGSARRMSIAPLPHINSLTLYCISLLYPCFSLRCLGWLRVSCSMLQCAGESSWRFGLQYSDVYSFVYCGFHVSLWCLIQLVSWWPVWHKNALNYFCFL